MGYWAVSMIFTWTSAWSSPGRQHDLYLDGGDDGVHGDESLHVVLVGEPLVPHTGQLEVSVVSVAGRPELRNINSFTIIKYSIYWAIRFFWFFKLNFVQRSLTILYKRKQLEYEALKLEKFNSEKKMTTELEGVSVRALVVGSLKKPFLRLP